MLAQLLAHLYTPDIQLSLQQIEAISGAVYTRQPKCKLLVFGCGNDSALWFALNKNGRTVFLETSQQWRDIVLAGNPDLEICQYSLPEITVQSSMSPENVPKILPPTVMLEEDWDVILIDGPPGHILEKDPGRALPIQWVAQCRTKKTHVFLDDMHRPLERVYGMQYLNITCEIHNEKEPEKIMGWSIGTAI